MKKLLEIFIYLFIYKIIYFCSLNIYLGSHKFKAIMPQCCYFAVAGWQCCYYVACSLLVVTAVIFLIHCINCWRKKYSILKTSFCFKESLTYWIFPQFEISPWNWCEWVFGSSTLMVLRFDTWNINFCQNPV